MKVADNAFSARTKIANSKPKEIASINAKCAAPVFELNDIKTPFTTFDLSNEGLRLP